MGQHTEHSRACCRSVAAGPKEKRLDDYIWRNGTTQHKWDSNRVTRHRCWMSRSIPIVSVRTESQTREQEKCQKEMRGIKSLQQFPTYIQMALAVSMGLIPTRKDGHHFRSLFAHMAAMVGNKVQSWTALFRNIFLGTDHHSLLNFLLVFVFGFWFPGFRDIFDTLPRLAATRRPSAGLARGNTMIAGASSS